MNLVKEFSLVDARNRSKFQRKRKKLERRKIEIY